MARGKTTPVANEAEAVTPRYIPRLVGAIFAQIMRKYRCSPWRGFYIWPPRHITVNTVLLNHSFYPCIGAIYSLYIAYRRRTTEGMRFK